MKEFVQTIKRKAVDLGFSGCRITDLSAVDATVQAAFYQSIEQGRHGKLSYLANNISKRLNPQELFTEAKSVIVFLANYYQSSYGEQNKVPKISQYALGKDYHGVLKQKLHQIEALLLAHDPNSSCRSFVDTAPVLEKYLAQRAGLGWIGKNTLLNTLSGSYFFIAEIFTSLELPIDSPFEKNFCNNCNRCQEACPTHALEKEYQLDARRCISYLSQVKELSDQDLDPFKLSKFIYGCDLCQQICPYNKRAKQSEMKEFDCSIEFLEKDKDFWQHLSQEEFDRLFQDTPVARIGYLKMKQNISCSCNNI